MPSGAEPGRRHPEPDDPLRSPFQRDRDRIVHSTAFRRLEHKTQVFVSHEGDHFRTRLTHTLEVAQIARTAARALGLDEDLAEAVALAHDLGHSPFGHAGEEALDAALAAHGGFDHNAQTLRVITCLERRYAEFDGLNPDLGDARGRGQAQRPAPARRAALCRRVPRRARSRAHHHASAEAQIAALADDIAYCNHDLDDGLRANLFTVDDLAGLPLVGGVFAEVASRYPEAERTRLINESRRRLISRMVVDMVEETARRLAALQPADADAVRAHDRPVVGFSPAVAEPLRQLRSFLQSRMYCHYKVRRMQRTARQVVRELFAVLLEQPDCLPPDWQARAGARRCAHRRGDRRLHRRHDRPLRSRRARAAVHALGQRAMNPFDQVRAEVLRAIEDCQRAGELPEALEVERITVEPPRDPAHGDAATNAALLLAKPAGRSPMELAELLAARLRAGADVATVEWRGPASSTCACATTSGGRRSRSRWPPAAATARPTWAGASGSTSSTAPPIRPGRSTSGTGAAPCSATRWPACSRWASR